MKKLILLLLIVPMLSFGEMTFYKTVHDFGVINQVESVQNTFTFTNTGQIDLIILDARASCERCIVMNYPKYTDIAPGDSGKFTVIFDSSNKPNMQSQRITISANTSEGLETLRIKANVIPYVANPRECKLARQNMNLTYKVGEDVYDLDDENMVAGFLEKYPNTIPLFYNYEESKTSKVDKKRGKKRSFKTIDGNRVREEEKKDYKGLGLAQIILILIIVILLILVKLYFTKSITRKTNIQHSATVETLPQEEVRSSFCTNCGTPINSETAFCTNCGNKI